MVMGKYLYPIIIIYLYPAYFYPGVTSYPYHNPNAAQTNIHWAFVLCIPLFTRNVAAHSFQITWSHSAWWFQIHALLTLAHIFGINNAQ